MSHIATTHPTPLRPSAMPLERVTGLHILIADPDRTSRAIREQQLLAAGHRVSVARTAFEALVKATCQVPDMILLDPALPGLAIVDTARFLSACPVTAHIPVVRVARGRAVSQRILTALRRRAKYNLHWVSNSAVKNCTVELRLR